MKIFGIIGKPLGHSFSKGYFEAKFKVLGIDDECRYYNFPLDYIAELGRILEEYPDLCGLNVTIPYKREVMPWLDEISDEARAIGAVNCIRIENGKLAGYNTDVYGFRAGLDRLLGIRPEGEQTVSNVPDCSGIRALVLGTGGAAAAVRYELAKAGIGYLSVSRGGGTNAGCSLKADDGGIAGCGSEGSVVKYSELTPEILVRHKLIVNTTPLGTFPDTDGKPDIPYDAIGAGHFLYDLVYNPAVTAFLSEGAGRGAAVINGEVMLHAQAEKGWEIWNL